MFRVTFTSSLSTEDQNDDSTINMDFAFPEQPVWQELLERFQDFLQANGYVFDVNAKFGIVTDDFWKPNAEEADKSVDITWDDEPVETIQRKGKGKKKT